jgi:hypothetical protein
MDSRKAARGLSCAASFISIWFASLPSYGETIAYWRFEGGVANTAAGTIADSSGNGLSGQAVGGPLYSSAVANNPVPQTGQANNLSLNFNGTQRVFIPDYAALQLDHSLTIEASIYVRSQPTVVSNIVFRGDDRNALDPYRLEILSGRVYFFVTGSNGQLATANAALPAFNSWLNVAGTLDDAMGAMKLYFNGTVVNSTTTSLRPFKTLVSNSNPGLGIGNTQSSNYSEYFDGFIDEVRISDVALSPSQLLSSVPEPAAFGIFLLGGAGLLARRRPPERQAPPV